MLRPKEGYNTLKLTSRHANRNFGRIMMNLSPLELIVIALVIVLLFGTRRLPELGSGLGKAISNFKKSYREGAALDVTPKEGEGEKKNE